MKVVEKILFTLMLMIVLSAFTIGDKISSPIMSAVLCTSMIVILLNRFIMNIKDEN